jgi:hypothetical protein
MRCGTPRSPAYLCTHDVRAVQTCVGPNIRRQACSKHIDDAIASLDIELTGEQIRELEARYTQSRLPGHLG